MASHPSSPIPQLNIPSEGKMSAEKRAKKIVQQEIQALLVAMRQNVRYASVAHKKVEEVLKSEEDKTKELVNLRDTLSIEGRPLDCTQCVTPFLDIVLSPDVNGPITGVAVGSIVKMLMYNIIDTHSLNAAEAMSRIANAMKYVKFEETDPATDDCVIFKTLEVFVVCLRSPAGSLLSDHSIWEMVETCIYIMNHASSFGELLRRVAEHKFTEIVQMLFSRLPFCQPERSSSGSKVGFNVDSPAGTPTSTSSFGSALSMPNGTTAASEENGPTPKAAEMDLAGANNASNLNGTESSGRATPTNTNIGKKSPYGINIYVKIFRFICDLIDLDKTQSEKLNILGLQLANTVLETGGHCVGQWPELLHLIQDDLCRLVLDLSLSDNLAIVAASLRVILNLFTYLRSHLKMQIEMFFSKVFMTIAEGGMSAAQDRSSYAVQEVALECLMELCKEPGLMSSLFVNYDCDINCRNVFEDLCKTLSRNSFPVSGYLNGIHLLSLQCLLAGVETIAQRCGDSPKTDKGDASVTFAQVESIRARKHMKKRLLIGADNFNRDPKKGLQYLQQIKILPDPLTPESVASFLRKTPNLNKQQVGNYIGHHHEFNGEVRKAFTKSFDFKRTSLDMALRVFLDTFRLPGEAQVIDRIMTQFSHQFAEDYEGDDVEGADPWFVLSFAIIMLNTDLHNTGVKKKMTLDEFINQNRGVNNEKNFPRQMLEDLYNSILHNEIRMSDEHQGVGDAMKHRWVDLLKKAQSAGEFLNDIPRALDQDMFSLIWGPTIAAISVVLETAQEKPVIEKAVTGYLTCAKIATHYTLCDVFDNIVISLCKFTNLLSSPDNPLIVFGMSKKAQLATYTVFSLTRKYMNNLREGWKNILDCILRLHKLDLLPASMTEIEDFLNGEKLTIPPATSMSDARISRSGSASFLSTFTQYLSLSEPTAVEPSEKEIEAEKLTKDCIKSCRINEIFSETSFLQEQSLTYLVKSLILAVRPKNSSGTVQVDINTAVFCLELLVEIALRNRDRIQLVWSLIFEHISQTIATNTQPTLLLERAVIAVLRLCNRLLHKEEIQRQVLSSLDLILKLEESCWDVLALQVSAGTLQLVKGSAAHIQTESGWMSLFSILSRLSSHMAGSTHGFEALTYLVAAPEKHFISHFNLRPCLETTLFYIESASEKPRSFQALDLLTKLHSRFAADESNGDAPQSAAGAVNGVVNGGGNSPTLPKHWAWMEILRALSKSCRDARGEIRNYALVCTQKALLSEEAQQLAGEAWRDAFHGVLFPLVSDLVNPKEDLKNDLSELEKSWLRLSTMISKTLLQYLPVLVELPDFSTLWFRILSCEESFLRGGQSELLSEAIPEQLKNILLVMSSSQVFAVEGDSSDGSGKYNSLWEQTWEVIDKFCPTLRSETFPPDERGAQVLFVSSDEADSQLWIGVRDAIAGNRKKTEDVVEPNFYGCEASVDLEKDLKEKKSAAVIVILSERYLASERCRTELATILDVGVPTVALIVSSTLAGPEPDVPEEATALFQSMTNKVQPIICDGSEVAKVMSELENFAK